MEPLQSNTSTPEIMLDQTPKWFTLASTFLKIGLVFNWMVVSAFIMLGAALMNTGGSYDQTSSFLVFGIFVAFLLTLFFWFLSKKLEKLLKFLLALVSLLFPFLYFPVIMAIWEHLDTLKNFQ